MGRARKFGDARLRNDALHRHHKGQTDLSCGPYHLPVCKEGGRPPAREEDEQCQHHEWEVDHSPGTLLDTGDQLAEVLVRLGAPIDGAPSLP